MLKVHHCFQYAAHRSSYLLIGVNALFCYKNPSTNFSREALYRIFQLGGLYAILFIILTHQQRYIVARSQSSHIGLPDTTFN